MNANQIKDILISYLKAANGETRIYQEKSVGNSICDLMTATDILTGYEIKSDLDNYTRLKSQIISYDKFFDKNYIVVGASHIDSAADKVPAHWGIIAVKRGSIEIIRQAKNNRSVNRKAQLSVLWKLELKNILIKNNLPLYAQRDKGYIISRVLETVDDETLGAQIAYELLHRDYSVYDAKDYTIYSEGVFSNLPAKELVDMLSENDLESFTLDKWIEIYKQAMDAREAKRRKYEQKPKRPEIEHKIPYTDIEVSLGVPWIGERIINDFFDHIIYDGRLSNDNCVYEPITGNWYISDKNSFNHTANATVKYGTKRYNAAYILEASLNLREIRLLNKNKKFDEAETLAALSKQKKMEREFKDWIWRDEDRIWEVEEAYNKMFAGYKAVKYDGSKLKFEGMSENFELYDYQKDAVKKILDSKNTLLAFDVGAGKTFIMIAAAMKMRKEGMSRRNMFVVPNHIVGQWEKMFTDLYPKAKVLAIEPKSFKPEMRKKVLRQIKEGDYDGVIIAYSCFNMIPLSRDTALANIGAALREIEAALRELSIGYEARGFYNSKSYHRKSALRKEKLRISEEINKFFNTEASKEEITFEDLEISTLFIDEAHNYKNLPVKTAMRGVSGINSKGSDKCLDMLHKIRCVQNSQNGKGAVFATGTPLCNSIADVYAMQVYLQYDELKNSGLEKFDSWIKTFAKPEQVTEIDVDTSKYRMVRKFTRFHNLPELSKMFSQIAVFYAVDENDVPVFDGYSDIVIKKYGELTGYMNSLCQRAEEIRSGKINPKHDNMLKVSIDGRKAALDLTLVGEFQPYDERSKIIKCVNNAVEIYNENESNTQIIFCDYSTPKANEFNVYREIKDRLTDRGVPANEIAFIHSYNTERKKAELFEAFNKSKKRILLGSTFKLGIGANVQTKLKAVHHLDVPWRPADMVQREGRIIRCGNENENVNIYRYICEGSFDSYSWQILETKQRFISQFLAGSAYQRETADLDDMVLTYGEVKAAALSEPLMKRLAEAENELKSLEIIAAKEKSDIEAVKAEIIELDRKIDALNGRRNTAERTALSLMKYGDSEKKALYQELCEVLTMEFVLGKQPAAQIKAFCFSVEIPAKQDDMKPYIFLKDEGELYKVEMGKTPKGNARRVINFIKSFGKMPGKTDKEIYEVQNRRRELKNAADNFDGANLDKLNEKRFEVNKLKMIVQQNVKTIKRD